jgi:hypothetical protein
MGDRVRVRIVEASTCARIGAVIMSGVVWHMTRFPLVINGARCVVPLNQLRSLTRIVVGQVDYKAGVRRVTEFTFNEEAMRLVKVLVLM